FVLVNATYYCVTILRHHITTLFPYTTLFRSEREVRLALDDDRVAHAPVETEARNDRISLAVERGVVAPECQHELPGIRTLEPGHEREAARQAHGLVQQPRVVSELRLDPEHALGRRE